jgi:hypothetical protein
MARKPVKALPFDKFMSMLNQEKTFHDGYKFVEPRMFVKKHGLTNLREFYKTIGTYNKQKKIRILRPRAKRTRAKVIKYGIATGLIIGLR